MKRVKGGLHEVLLLRGGDIATTLDQAFQVNDADGNRLLTDGTGRFISASPAAVAAVEDIEEPGVAGEP